MSEARTAEGVFKQDPEQTNERPELFVALEQTEEVIKSLLIKIKNDAALVGGDDDAVPRWVSLARTHFETGLMFAEMAISRPPGGIGRLK